MAPYLQQLVPALLFELSDRDPNRFMRTVGYGHSAGYLFSRGVQLSPEDSEAGSSGNTWEDLSTISLRARGGTQNRSMTYQR